MSISQYGVVADSALDAVLAVKQALVELAATGGGTLLFPPGRYDFWSDYAVERYVFASNNDAGLQRIAFPLIGLSDIAIRGEAAEFVFHGAITPFLIEQSSGISVSGVTVDYERSFVSEAEVIDVTGSADGLSEVTIRLPNAYPYSIQDERLTFLGERDEIYQMGNTLEWNPLRREPAFRVHDNYHIRNRHRAKEIESGIVELVAQYSTIPTPGNVLAIEHAGRRNPGFVISASTDITISDVTIHHARGMGIVAQWTENIRVERVKVIPAANKGRIISAAADATHFVNCKGLVELIDCTFEGQMDDPTNIHGIYARISRILDKNSLEVELVHPQQFGVEITRVGDTIEIVNQESLQTRQMAAVTEVNRLNQQFTQISVAEPVDNTVRSGDSVTSVGWTCDAILRGCETGRNRARGFLISTPGKVLVERNHFYNPGAAIIVAGDANYWFESGGVRDLTIRNNYFDNCLYGVWGRAVIDIEPQINPEHRHAGQYHKGIKIIDNTFDVFDPRIIKAHCVDGLLIAGNSINASSEYPVQLSHSELFDITDSRRIVIENNKGAEHLLDSLTDLAKQVA